MRRNKRAGALIAAAIFGLAIAGGGCAIVKPWEREMLARPDMAWDPDPLETARRGHVYFSKEATPPGGPGGGGGCGCN